MIAILNIFEENFTKWLSVIFEIYRPKKYLSDYSTLFWKSSELLSSTLYWLLIILPSIQFYFMYLCLWLIDFSEIYYLYTKLMWFCCVQILAITVIYLQYIIYFCLQISQLVPDPIALQRLFSDFSLVLTFNSLMLHRIYVNYGFG